MRTSIFDLFEFVLLAFFAALGGASLAISLAGNNSPSAVIVLVATDLLLVVMLIQFLRKLRSAR